MNRYEVKFLESDSDYDYRMALQIWIDGKPVNEFWDGGEPEDNSFGRDWSWVADELEKAYELGYKHAVEEVELGI